MQGPGIDGAEIDLLCYFIMTPHGGATKVRSGLFRLPLRFSGRLAGTRGRANSMGELIL